MKKVFYKCIFLLFISFCSCSTESEFEKELTNKSKKWVYVDNPTFNKNATINFYLKFSKSNVCTNYSLKNDEKSGESGKWSYSEKDSSLSVFGHEYKFLKINEDSIYVKYKKENFVAMFMNVADNTTIRSSY